MNYAFPRGSICTTIRELGPEIPYYMRRWARKVRMRIIVIIYVDAAQTLSPFAFELVANVTLNLFYVVWLLVSYYCFSYGSKVE